MKILIYNFKCDECNSTEYSIIKDNSNEFTLVCDKCGEQHNIKNFNYKIEN